MGGPLPGSAQVAVHHEDRWSSRVVGDRLRRDRVVRGVADAGLKLVHSEELDKNGLANLHRDVDVPVPLARPPGAGDRRAHRHGRAAVDVEHLHGVPVGEDAELQGAGGVEAEGHPALLRHGPVAGLDGLLLLERASDKVELLGHGVCLHQHLLACNAQLESDEFTVRLGDAQMQLKPRPCSRGREHAQEPLLLHALIGGVEQDLGLPQEHELPGWLTAEDEALWEHRQAELCGQCRLPRERLVLEDLPA
mmetsp:Transcript_49663/g.142061  ORF Transcript_49663/g.142061 Transcript_49663/m.142061 type:complete len:250 (-) Transcript_49663:994-1743(-)